METLTYPGEEYTNWQATPEGSNADGQLRPDSESVPTVQLEAAIVNPVIVPEAAKLVPPSVSGSVAIDSFTKERAPEARQALAQEIREQRSAYFQEKADFHAEISQLSQEIQEHRVSLEQATREIEQLSVELEKNTSTKIGELINYFTNVKLTQQIADKRQRIEGYKQLLTDRETLRSGLSKLVEDKHTYRELRARLQNEAIQGKNEIAEREVNARSVEAISREKNVLFVHGIDVESVMGVRAVDTNKDLTSEDRLAQKIKINIAFSPALAVSTIRVGVNDRVGFVGGVILGAGEVRAIFGKDAYSMPDGLKHRRAQGVEFHTGKNYQSALNTETADPGLEQGGRNERLGYNELLVGQTELAGLYIQYRENGQQATDDQALFQDASNELGLPFYGLKEGVPVRVKIENGRIVADDRPLDAATILNEKADISQDQKQKYAAEILADPPFNYVLMKDKISAYSRGRESYLATQELNDEAYTIPALGRSYRVEAGQVVESDNPNGSREGIISRTGLEYIRSQITFSQEQVARYVQEIEQMRNNPNYTLEQRQKAIKSWEGEERGYREMAEARLAELVGWYDQAQEVSKNHPEAIEDVEEAKKLLTEFDPGFQESFHKELERRINPSNPGTFRLLMEDIE